MSLHVINLPEPTHSVVPPGEKEERRGVRWREEQQKKQEGPDVERLVDAGQGTGTGGRVARQGGRGNVKVTEGKE